MEGTTADEQSQRVAALVPLPVRRPTQVSFDRHELSTILNLYGRMVALGEWRDYAIDFGREKAVFSIYRRASETPLFRVIKDPSLARRQGAYAVMTGLGQVLKRGHELDRVLAAIEPKPKLAIV